MTHALAGLRAPADVLTDIPALLAAYFNAPDVTDPQQRVAFGTSGHRGCALQGSFNEAHILAIAQAVGVMLLDPEAETGLAGTRALLEQRPNLPAKAARPVELAVAIGNGGGLGVCEIIGHREILTIV